jgi:hypothetical protein
VGAGVRKASDFGCFTSFSMTVRGRMLNDGNGAAIEELITRLQN